MSYETITNARDVPGLLAEPANIVALGMAECGRGLLFRAAADPGRYGILDQKRGHAVAVGCATPSGFPTTQSIAPTIRKRRSASPKC